MIASDTRITVKGSVFSTGGNGSGGGSGGAIRLVARLVDGTGALRASEGGSFENGDWNGGAGRIRIDSLDREEQRSISGNGKYIRGTQMFVFPPNPPKLDIVEAAGQSIAEGTTNLVAVMLPAGASTNQTIKVQARNFTSDVPIRVQIAPESARSSFFDATIKVIGGENPPAVSVPVVIPVDTVCHVNVWSR